MDQRLLRFAELLFRGDPTAVAAARDAFAEPGAFIAAHASALGYVRPKRGWAPEPWLLLLDVAKLQDWLQAVDWRAGSDEVAASVAALVPAAALPIDWGGLGAAHQESETREFLRILARSVPDSERLIHLDDGSDSYSLALLPAASLPEAAQLAAEIDGQVEALNWKKGTS